MKKRMMAMLMTAILVIASIPFTAFAEEMPAEVLGGEVMEAVAAEAAEAEAIPAAAGEEAEAAAEVTKTTLAGVDSTDWEKLQDAIGEPSPAPISGVFDVSYEEGTGIKILKLLKDITAASSDTSYLSVPDNSKLILDLNGKTLDRGLKGRVTSVTKGNVIKAGEGVSLTIKNGTITGSYPTNTGGKGALYCEETTELNLINVKFDECKNTALYIKGVNSTNIKECTFYGNTYGGGRAGGAAIDVGSSNKQQKITIENCSFENNVITGGSGSAIHLFVETGDIDMTIKGSTFTENHAESDISDDGGAICAYSGSLVLDGCTITGNRAATNNNCGGVSVSKDVKSFIIKGKTVIKDNTCGGEPADLCLQNNGAKFKVEDLNPEAKIGVKALYGFTGTSVIAEGLKAGDIKCFFPDDPMYQLTVSEGSLFIKPATVVTTFTDLQNAVNAASEGVETTIVLGGDIKDMTSYLNIAKDKKIVLDLNNHTLDRGLAEKGAVSSGNVIKVGEGASLTVKNGKITGANASSGDGALRGDKTNLLQLNNVRFEDCKGSALSLSDVECANIEGCTFIGNEGNNGGAIDIKATDSSNNDQKAVTIKDSLFKNNRAIKGSGSAIRIYGNWGEGIPIFRYADVTIINSTFTGNVAEKASDASTICAYRLNSLVLDGCTITENTAVTGSNCAGFSIGKWVDKLTIKGKTVIKDNTVDGKPSDMSLYNEDKTTFKVEGLDPESEIGIKLKTDIGEGQSRVIVEDFNAEDKDCFFSDDPKYQLISKDGKLRLSLAQNYAEVEFDNTGKTPEVKPVKLLDGEGTLTLPDDIPEKTADTKIAGVKAIGNVDVTVHGDVNNDYFEQSGFVYTSETGVTAGGEATVTVDGLVKNANADGVTANGNAVVTVAGCVDGVKTGVRAYGKATVIAKGENAADAIRGHENFGAYVTNGATVKAEGNILSDGEAAIHVFTEANGATVEVAGNAAAEGFAVHFENKAAASTVKISGDAIVPEEGYAIANESEDSGNIIMVEGTAKGDIYAAGGSVYVGKLEGEIEEGVENVCYLIGFSADGAGLKEFNFSGVSGAPTGVNGKVYNAVSANQIAGSQITITPKEAGKRINTSKLQLPAGVTKVEENGALILKFDANFKGGLQNMVLTFGDGPKPDPTPSSDDSEPLFTGNWGNPVKNGRWTQDANGIWSYTSTETFRNTWGYIANPYAQEGQHQADWFLFDQYGHMLIGWQLKNGKWYYLNPTKDGTLGACLLGPGKTPDGYEIDASGAWTGR